MFNLYSVPSQPTFPLFSFCLFLPRPQDYSRSFCFSGNRVRSPPPPLLPDLRGCYKNHDHTWPRSPTPAPFACLSFQPQKPFLLVLLPCTRCDHLSSQSQIQFTSPPRQGPFFEVSLQDTSYSDSGRLSTPPVSSSTVVRARLPFLQNPPIFILNVGFCRTRP